MMYNLWLDDDAGKPGIEAWRNPPANSRLNWKVAHSTQEAQAIVLEFGIPQYIDFDHDLGMGDDAMVFLHWLSTNFPDAVDHIQGYRVHSRNEPGRQNIRAFMDSWRKARTLP